MIRKPRALAIVAVVCVLLPLLRLFSSPSFEPMRAVDLILLFTAGMATGVLLVALNVLRRQANDGETGPG